MNYENLVQEFKDINIEIESVFEPEALGILADRLDDIIKSMPVEIQNCILEVVVDKVVKMQKKKDLKKSAKDIGVDTKGRMNEKELVIKVKDYFNLEY